MVEKKAGLLQPDAPLVRKDGGKGSAVASDVPLGQRLIAAMHADPPAPLYGVTEEIAKLDNKDRLKLGAELKKAGVSFEQLAEYLTLDAPAEMAVRTAAAFLPPQQRAEFIARMTPKLDTLASARAHEPPSRATVSAHLRALQDASSALKKAPNDEAAKAKFAEARAQIASDVQLSAGDPKLLLALGEGIEHVQAHEACDGLMPALPQLSVRLRAANVSASDLELYGATGEITKPLQDAMDAFQKDGGEPESTVLTAALGLRAAVLRARGDTDTADAVQARADALPDVGHERQLALAGRLADVGKNAEAIALLDSAGQYFATRPNGKELKDAAFTAQATLLLVEATKQPRKTAVALERLSTAIDRMKQVSGQEPLTRALLRARIELRGDEPASVQDRMQLLKADEARAQALLAKKPLSLEEKAELIACASEYAQLASGLAANGQLLSLAEADLDATAAATEQAAQANNPDAVARAAADRARATDAKRLANDYAAALKKSGHGLLDPMSLLSQAAGAADTPSLKRAHQLAVADTRAAHAQSEIRAAAASKERYLVAEWRKDDGASEAALRSYDAHTRAAGALVDQAAAALDSAQPPDPLISTRVAQAAFSVRSDLAVAILERAEKVPGSEDLVAAAAMYGKTVVDGPGVRFGGHSKAYRSRTAQGGAVLGAATGKLIAIADRTMSKSNIEARKQITEWKGEIDFAPLAAAAKRRAVKDLTKLDGDVEQVKAALNDRTKSSAGFLMNGVMHGETWLASKVGLGDAHDFRAEDAAEVEGQIGFLAQDGAALSHHYQNGFSAIARADQGDYALKYRLAALLRDPRSNPTQWKAELVQTLRDMGSSAPEADANELEILIKNDPHMAMYQKAGRSSATEGLQKLYDDPNDTVSMFTPQLITLGGRYEDLAGAHAEIETFKVKLCNAGVDAAGMYLLTLGVGGAIGAVAKNSANVARIGTALATAQRGAAAYGRLTVMGAEFSGGAFAFSAAEAGVGLGIQKLVGYTARKAGVQNEALLFLIDSGAGALNLGIAAKAAGFGKAAVMSGSEKALFARIGAAGLEVGKNMGMAYTLTAAPLVIEELGVDPAYAHIIGDALFVLGTGAIGGFAHAGHVSLKDKKLDEALDKMIEGGEPPILTDAEFNQVVNALKLKLALEKIPEPELTAHDPASVQDYFARRAEYFKEVEKLLAEDMTPEDAARMIADQTRAANVGLLLGLEKKLEGNENAQRTLNGKLGKQQRLRLEDLNKAKDTDLQANLQALHDQVAATVATESPHVAELRATRKALTQPGDPATRAKQMAELEAAISDPNVTIVAMRPTSDKGINGSYIVELSNGVKAIWKPSSGEHLGVIRQNLEEDHQARREAAAYQVDKALGHLAGVPPTVFRSFAGEQGSLMVFADAAADGFNGSPKPGAAGPLSLFDQLIGNCDRHRGNYLVTADGSIVPIDHGLAFPLKNGAQGDGWFAFDATRPLKPEEKAVLEDMLARKQELGAELLKLGIDAQAINAMFDRGAQMLAEGGTNKSWHQK